MPDIPDELPCIICGKMAKTLRHKDGKPFQAGIHQKCWEREGEKYERIIQQEAKREDN